MHTQRAAYERLRGVLSEAEEPLTAKEIMSLLEERGVEIEVESTHKIATILGRVAEEEYDEVEVVQDTPYRYQLNT